MRSNYFSGGEKREREREGGRGKNGALEPGLPAT